LNFSSIII